MSKKKKKSKDKKPKNKKGKSKNRKSQNKEESKKDNKNRDGEEIIKLENVCKNYIMGEEVVKAVCNVDISVNKGEFIAVMGPSGSGKSTLMNLIGSLDVPTKGKIYLDGNNIADLIES